MAEIDDKNAENIINELKEADPGLEGKEEDLKLVIKKMIDFKPEVSIDPVFKENLRKKLDSRVKNNRGRGIIYFIPRLVLPLAAVLLIALIPGILLKGPLKSGAAQPLAANKDEISLNDISETLADKADPSYFDRSENEEAADVFTAAKNELDEIVLEPGGIPGSSEHSFLPKAASTGKKFDINIDNSNYQKIAKFISSGILPEKGLANISEIVSRFSYNIGSAKTEKSLTASAEMAADPLDPHRILLLISLNGNGNSGISAEDIRIDINFENANQIEISGLGGKGSSVNEESSIVNDLNAGQSAAAIYKIIPLNQETTESGLNAAIKLSFIRPATGERESISLAVKSLSPNETSDAFKFSTAVANWAEIINDPRKAEANKLDEILALAEDSINDADPDKMEFIGLVRKTIEIYEKALTN